ncbi:hypothetical protein Afil01_42800 [Actinorhabdospora filicis]|uniref:Extracellular small neutral protease n=1 Tax=Actinorhabdospora filicis TaxID=1785913 RepID=A0A9W6SNI0_9ACTN|nr:snapalysin family zinc-dependent metalloprotease [Actinorhabdospora filicis]GLZ79473.1 hypothetical protein Afil01_42800 [Actinorhabdospora filicis]
MLAKRSFRVLTALMTMALALIGVQLVAESAAIADSSLNVRTVYYSASAYGTQADQAAQIWSSRAPNVRMVRGGSATIRIYGTTGGGSRAYPCGAGCATIYIDSNDIRAGHNPLRIVTHEIGHGLGLPDNYNGVCSYLMSGGSAGTSCTNPYPNAAEANRVNQIFAFNGARIGPFATDVYAPAS